jgi:hypothetical protein
MSQKPEDDDPVLHFIALCRQHLAGIVMPSPDSTDPLDAAFKEFVNGTWAVMENTEAQRVTDMEAEAREEAPKEGDDGK